MLINITRSIWGAVECSEGLVLRRWLAMGSATSLGLADGRKRAEATSLVSYLSGGHHHCGFTYFVLTQVLESPLECYMTRPVRSVTTILDERLHERVMHNDLKHYRIIQCVRGLKPAL